MVLLDAMNYGLPVIASDIGGIPEIVEHNRTGLLFDPGNPQALATAIQQLASSPKLALQLAEAAFEKLKLQYSSEISPALIGNSSPLARTPSSCIRVFSMFFSVISAAEK